MKYRSIDSPFEVSKEAAPTHSPEGFKYITTVYLKTIISEYKTIPIFVVIEDTFDPWEDGRRYANRAFNVYMDRAFIKALKAHPEYNENLVVEELPENVIDGLEKTSISRYGEVHMFEGRHEFIY